MHGWDDDEKDDYEEMNKRLLKDAGLDSNKPGRDNKPQPAKKAATMDAKRAERVPSEDR